MMRCKILPYLQSRASSCYYKIYQPSKLSIFRTSEHPQNLPDLSHLSTEPKPPFRHFCPSRVNNLLRTYFSFTAYSSISPPPIQISANGGLLPSSISSRSFRSFHSYGFRPPSLPLSPPPAGGSRRVFFWRIFNIHRPCLIFFYQSGPTHGSHATPPPFPKGTSGGSGA